MADDAAAVGVARALLVVLRPGALKDFDRSAVIRRAEKEHSVVLRVTAGARELLHEAFSAGDVALDEFCAALPRAVAEALEEIRASEASLETWAAITSRWR